MIIFLISETTQQKPCLMHKKGFQIAGKFKGPSWWIVFWLLSNWRSKLKRDYLLKLIHLDLFYYSMSKASSRFYFTETKKNAVEINGLNSSIISKVDHQMSRNWKKVASSFWKLLTNLVGWKFAYLISQLMTGIRQKLFRLKVYFKPKRKNPDFGVLPVPLLAVSVKIGNLRCQFSSYMHVTNQTFKHYTPMGKYINEKMHCL